jgi:hypothetical protein
VLWNLPGVHTLAAMGLLWALEKDYYAAHVLYYAVLVVFTCERVWVDLQLDGLGVAESIGCHGD